MSFEKLFQPREGEKMEGGLDVQEKMIEVKEKIKEKSTSPEAKKYFEEKDQENVAKLESHPESEKKEIFKISRLLMRAVKDNPDIVTDNAPKHFYPDRI